MDQRKKIDRLVLRAFQFGGFSIRPDAIPPLREWLLGEVEPDEKIKAFVAAIDRNESRTIVDAELVERLLSRRDPSPETNSAFDPPVLESDVPLLSIEFIRVIDAFDVPCWTYDVVKKTFISDKRPRSLFPTNATAKGEIYRERFKLLYQRIRRHPSFAPSVLSGPLRSKDAVFPLTEVDSISGTAGTKFVFGMISRAADGSFVLEDLTGSIPISVSSLEMKAPGFFTETSFVIVEGFLSEDGVTFLVKKVAQPVLEERSASLVAIGRSDFFGAGFRHSEMKAVEAAEVGFAGKVCVVSDVFLNQSSVRDGLEVFLSRLEHNPPTVLVMCGSFSSSEAPIDSLKVHFDGLSRILANFPTLCASTRFVIVPGPNDPTPSCGVLPSAPLPTSCQELFKRTVRSVSFATNPCRIRFYTREIVVFRDDLMTAIRRQSVFPPPTEGEPQDHLARTLVEQAHLCPVALDVRPLFWSFDHAMRLYPHPHFIVLADHYRQFKCSYHETVIANPGRFCDGMQDLEFDPLRGESDVVLNSSL